MELRPEQRVIVDKAKKVLSEKGIVYLAAQLRTGKSIMSMTIAHEGVRKKYNKILFVTKVKAISSVESDLARSGYKFEKFKVTNYEQLQHEFPFYDLIIADEAHGLGAFAKPSLKTKELKRIMGSADLILMSGTPHPQSPSQIYHQFWVHELSPFASNYPTFYKWAKDFVTVKKKHVNGYDINDYSHAKEDKVKEAIEPYLVTFSQEQAGFTSFVDEEVLEVDINPQMYGLMKVLKKDKVYRMKKTGDIILCDTKVKMQSVFHQISSGTIKVGEKRHTLDEAKANFIKEKFRGKKICIFYQFIQEGEVLRKAFPIHTDIPEIFADNTNVTFICQLASGSMGINLSSADALVMYNISFSAAVYWQVRGRMQTKDRVKASKIYWIFSKFGLEKSIYKAVQRKKDFTLTFFKQYLKNEI